MVDDAAQRSKRQSSSFYMPMLALPAPKRSAMLALYDICRAIDDAVDEADNRKEARARLASWRREIDRMFKGSASHPLAVTLYPFLIEYGLKKQYFDEMMDGIAMDADDEMYAPALSRLYLYCYRVAGTVGLLSMQIFGCQGKHAEMFATELGYALQLTNILRDVTDDFERGRVYLPAEYFDDVGLPPQAFTPDYSRHTEMREELGEIAFRHFMACDELLPQLDVGKLKAALMMKHIYQQQLQEMKEKRWVVPLASERHRPKAIAKVKLLAQGIRYLFS